MFSAQFCHKSDCDEGSKIVVAIIELLFNTSINFHCDRRDNFVNLSCHREIYYEKQWREKGRLSEIDLNCRKEGSEKIKNDKKEESKIKSNPGNWIKWALTSERLSCQIYFRIHIHSISSNIIALSFNVVIACCFDSRMFKVSLSIVRMILILKWRMKWGKRNVWWRIYVDKEDIQEMIIQEIST